MQKLQDKGEVLGRYELEICIICVLNFHLGASLRFFIKLMSQPHDRITYNH